MTREACLPILPSVAGLPTLVPGIFFRPTREQRAELDRIRRDEDRTMSAVVRSVVATGLAAKKFRREHSRPMAKRVGR